MRKSAKFAIAGLLIACTSNAAAAPTVGDFAQLPTFADLEIAPGGRYFAARINNNNFYEMSVFDISGANFSHVQSFAETDELSTRWFHWVTAEHLLVSMTFTGERGGSLQTTETRLYVIDAETRETTTPFRYRRSEVQVQLQDNIVSFLPNDPDHILIQYSRENPQKPDVYRVDITKSAKHRRVKRGRAGVYDWMTDWHDDIRLGSGLKGERKPYLIIRLAGDDDWLNYSHRVSNESIIFHPLAFANDPNKMYVASNHEGDPSGLYIFDIETDEFQDLIFKHSSVDIANIDVDLATGELRSIKFVEDYVETVYFTRRPMADAIEELMRQYPNKRASIASVTDDGGYAIILIQGPGDAGAYYLLDQVTPKIRKLPPQYPGLDSDSLGNTISTTYDARDGLTIPAFVTLPPGMSDLDSASRLAFVILPHGGPAVRDFLRFDYLVQFLVSRGYGVLQMNYRGSAGYGQSFRDAGNREWGKAMQDDITDGVHWLIENEHADPERIAIMGGSYGGYAALMGAVKTPDLYQCTISFAGVADLPDLIRKQRKYIGGRYATRFIGDLWKDRGMLVENSPARRAEEIDIPVLLLHGDNDVVVDIQQSTKMANALRKHGKQYEYVRFENGDHHLSLHANRLAFLTKTEEFLAECLN